MATFVALVLATVLICVKSAPVDVDSTASASSAMHLFVKGSEDTTNYHLTPFTKEFDYINEEITSELDAILPYINLFFDTLFNRSGLEEESGCVDDMVIQLVPEKPTSIPDDDDESSSSDDSSAADVIAA